MSKKVNVVFCDGEFCSVLDEKKDLKGVKKNPRFWYTKIKLPDGLTHDKWVKVTKEDGSVIELSARVFGIEPPPADVPIHLTRNVLAI